MNDPVNIEDNFTWYTFGQSVLTYRALPEMVDAINSHYEKLLRENKLPNLNERKGPVEKINDAYSIYYNGVDTANFPRHNFLPPAILEWMEARVKHYLEWNSITHRGIKTQFAWVNDYKAGDYNPLHTHTGDYNMFKSPLEKKPWMWGVAIMIILKLPTDMGQEQAKNNYNPKNGALEIIGPFSSALSSVAKRSLIPELVEGSVVVFPYDMLHTVYPHFNENEIRRTMPFNVDVYLDDDVITEEQENYDLRYNDKKDK